MDVEEGPVTLVGGVLGVVVLALDTVFILAVAASLGDPEVRRTGVKDDHELLQRSVDQYIAVVLSVGVVLGDNILQLALCCAHARPSPAPRMRLPDHCALLCLERERTTLGGERAL